MEKEKKNRKLLWSPKYDEFRRKVCPRCDKIHQMKVPLCRDCRNEVGRLERRGEWTNPGNIKDTFCHIRINFTETDYLEVEYNLEGDELKKVIERGYGFILKETKNNDTDGTN